MLCVKKHSHAQWRDFKMNVLVCDDDRKIVDSIIEELKKKSEEMHGVSLADVQQQSEPVRQSRQ